MNGGSDDIVLREAGPDDAARLLELARGLARTQGDPDDLLTLEAVRSHMLSGANAMTVIVAEKDGALGGYAALLPAFESGEASPGLFVSDLYVEEGLRGRGIGRRLMAAAAAHARRQGGRHLWLTMQQTNHGADRFYRRIADVRARVIAHAVTGDAFDALADAAGNPPIEGKPTEGTDKE